MRAPRPEERARRREILNPVVLGIRNVDIVVGDGYRNAARPVEKAVAGTRRARRRPATG
jgi:hypothetical protein